jgi:hypothetical protein
MDMKIINEFAELWKKKKANKEQKEDIQEQLDALGPKIEDMLIENGIDKMALKGHGTIFIHTRHIAKVEDKKEAANALRAAGFGNIINADYYDSRTLASLVAEFVKSGDDLPEEFNDIIIPDKIHTVRIKAS